MNGAKCLICAAGIPEERQVCERCAEMFAPCADLMAAALNKTPVEYRGVKYGCISAFTVRLRSSRIYALKSDYILQVELMSGKENCTVVANPKEIQILKGWKK